MKTNSEILDLLSKIHEAYVRLGYVGPKTIQPNLGLTDESSINMIREVCAITKPKNILEIGFYAGSSASVFMSVSDANLVSIDCLGFGITYEMIKPALVCFGKVFPDRHTFILGKSQHPSFINQLIGINRVRPFDLVFIDGWHSAQAVFHDILVSITLRIPFLLLDDYFIVERGRGHVVDGTEIFQDKYPNTIKLEKIFDYKTDTPHIMKAALFRNLITR